MVLFFVVPVRWYKHNVGKFSYNDIWMDGWMDDGWNVKDARKLMHDVVDETFPRHLLYVFMVLLLKCVKRWSHKHKGIPKIPDLLVLKETTLGIWVLQL